MTTTPCRTTSLRERKRAETRRTLALAAYTIVRDEGVDAVTAEAVAERAGVSRRTFFNYFPSVEQVLTASVAEFFTALSRRLDERPQDEPLRASLLAVVDDPSDLDLVERIGVLVEAGESSAHAKSLILGELHTWLDWLEGWLRGRLGDAPSELHVAFVATSILACGEAALRVWARHAAGSETPTRSFQAAFTEAIALLGTDLLPDDTVVAGRS
ncbi:TetR family transcriptional regulator [Phycicoccus sp. BSK3Z-2]|uniref:TetR family transcriptional regulator n=1 Tax=Phycicoccus avicenniae TaxID=2828860 RepID=A0A941I1C6_9MICO|nr:TetR family transcriptional regulator [Phycicoccus avicenniae]MBR7744785.1 TetR family transcriptional regulator [Phycicoccus avicenniae]